MSNSNINRRAPKIIHYLMLIIGVVLIINFNVSERRNKNYESPTLDQLKDVFHGDVNGKPEQKPLPHYTGTVDAGKVTTPAICVSTTQVGPVFKGYVDEINTLVVLDEKGIIRGVKIIAHKETPEYMRRVIDDGFIERMVGKDIQKGLHDVDTVTGASITALAIRNDVVSAAGQAAFSVYSIDAPVPPIPSWFVALQSPVFLAVLISLVFALYAKFGRWPKSHRNTVSGLISIALIGIFAMTPFTLTHISQLLKTGLPGPENALITLLALFIILTSFLAGPVWCQYACPFGAMQEFLSKVPIRRWKISTRVFLISREIRYLVLFVCVIGIFGFGKDSFSSVEPFGHLFGRSEMTAAWVFIIVTLLASVFVKRFWCRFFLSDWYLYYDDVCPAQRGRCEYSYD